jgi:hypothetical protein
MILRFWNGNSRSCKISTGRLSTRFLASRQPKTTSRLACRWRRRTHIDSASSMNKTSSRGKKKEATTKLNSRRLSIHMKSWSCKVPARSQTIKPSITTTRQSWDKLIRACRQWLQGSQSMSWRWLRRGKAGLIQEEKLKWDLTQNRSSNLEEQGSTQVREHSQMMITSTWTIWKMRRCMKKSRNSWKKTGDRCDDCYYNILIESF